MRSRTKATIAITVTLLVAALGGGGAYYYYNVLPQVRADREFQEGVRLYEAGDYVESTRHLFATLQRPRELVPEEERIRAVELLGLIGARYWDRQRSGVFMGATSAPSIPQIVGVLATSLRDEEATVRKAAVEALAMTGAQTAVKPLAGVLEDPDVSVRREAVFALATIHRAEHLNSRYHPPALRPQVDAAYSAARQALAAALKDSDSEVRQRAAIAFGRIGERDTHRYEPRAGPLLREAFQDESLAVRIYAHQALHHLLWHSRVEDQRKALQVDAVPLLHEALEHEDWTVRYTAAYVALNIHDETVVEPLHRALQDQYQPVRLAAARALGEIEDPTSIEPLVAVLGDRDAAVRYRAAEALAAIGESAIGPLQRASADANSRRRLGVALALGMIQRNLAAQALDRPADRQLLAHALAAEQALDRPADRQLLAHALAAEDEAGRQSAAELAGILGDKTLVEPLVAALADEHCSVRYRAVEALGKIGDTAALEPMIQALSDPHQAVRVKAAEALGGIKDTKAAEALIEAMKRGVKNEDYSTRYFAWDALSKIGAPAVPALIANLGYQGPPWGRSAVLDGRIKGYECANEFPIPLGKIGAPAVEPLIKALKNNDLAVQNAALLGLAGVWATSEYWVPVIDILSSEWSVVRGDAMNAFVRGDAWVPSEPSKPLPVILGIRVRPNLYARREPSRSAPVISAEPTAAAVDAVIKVLNEACRDESRPATHVQRAAVLALGNIGSPRAVDHLLKLVTEPSFLPKIPRHTRREITWNAGSALGRIKARQCVPRLIDAVKDRRVRGLAAFTLGQIGDPRAIEPLEEALKDESATKEFRDRVAKALAKIKGEGKSPLERLL